jgi:hypothetical protein
LLPRCCVDHSRGKAGKAFVFVQYLQTRASLRRVVRSHLCHVYLCVCVWMFEAQQGPVLLIFVPPSSGQPPRCGWMRVDLFGTPTQQPPALHQPLLGASQRASIDAGLGVSTHVL